MSTKLTSSEAEYFVKDSQADLIVTEPHYVEKFESMRNA